MLVFVKNKPYFSSWTARFGHCFVSINREQMKLFHLRPSLSCIFSLYANNGLPLLFFSCFSALIALTFTSFVNNHIPEGFYSQVKNRL
jgi:hypothetical protein